MSKSNSRTFKGPYEGYISEGPRIKVPFGAEGGWVLGEGVFPSPAD